MCAGIFAAQLINYGTKEIYPWGWRLSLALGGVPGIMLFVGALLLPDTPNRYRGQPLSVTTVGGSGS